MEKSSKPVKPMSPETKADEPTEKAIKLSLAHHRMLKEELLEINRDKSFSKTIKIRRYLEKLIEKCRKDCIDDLKKEREGGEDWFKLEYERLRPDMPFWDWLKAEYQKGARGKPAKAREQNEQKSTPKPNP